MIREAFRDSSIYIVSVFLTRGINILLLPFYTHALNPSDYGNVDLLYTLAAIVNLAIALEVTQAIARFLPDIKNPEERIRYISSAHWFTIGVFLLFGIIMILFEGLLKDAILSRSVSSSEYTIGILSIVVQGPFNYLTNLLKWSMRAKANAMVNLIASLTIIAVSLPTVLFFEWGIMGVFLGTFTGNLLGTVIAWIAVRKDLRFVFHFEALKELLRYSAPLVLSSAAIFISIYTDRILLKLYHSAAMVGLYGIAFRFASLVHLFLFGLQNGVTPLIVNHYREPDAPAKVEQILRYYLILTAMIVLGLALFSKEILVLFTSPDYYQAWIPISLLAFALFLSNAYFLAPGLSLRKKTSIIAFISIGCALANLIMNLVLIPAYHIVGAAIATGISSGLMMGLYFWFNQKYFPLPMKVGRYLVYGLLMSVVATGIALYYYVEGNTFSLDYPKMIVKIVILLVVGLLTLLSLFSRDEIKSTFATIVSAVGRLRRGSIHL
jgi:O-antigen/teichoic acid export membrane protein